MRYCDLITEAARLQGWMIRQSGLRVEGLSVAERRVGNGAAMWRDKRVRSKYVKRDEVLTYLKNMNLSAERQMEKEVQQTSIKATNNQD